MKIVILLTLTVLSGCASLEPFSDDTCTLAHGCDAGIINITGE